MRLNLKLITPSLLTLSMMGLAACQPSEQSSNQNLSGSESVAVEAPVQKAANDVKPQTVIIEPVKDQPVAVRSSKDAVPNVELPNAELPEAKQPDVKAPTIKRLDAQAPARETPLIDTSKELTPDLIPNRPIKNARVKAVEVQTTPLQAPPQQIFQPAAPVVTEAAPVQQPIAEPDVTPVVASAPVKQWQTDPANSHLKFTALQEGEAFQGEFKTFTADIKFSPDDLAASSVRVTVPISSVDAGSTDRNSTLPGKAWFSVKKFPDAVFSAQSFEAAGAGAYVANGALTMKGVSRDLSLPFTLDVTGETAVMRAALTMNRTQWDIGAAPWNTDEWVGKNVELDILVTAQAAP